MNWLGFAAAALVTLLLQTAVAWSGLLPAIPIDLLLALALLYGLSAPVHDARLAALAAGLLADLFTLGPVGLRAFAFGLAGLLVTQLRARANRELWWVRLGLGAVAALPGQILILLHFLLLQGAGALTLRDVLGQAVLTSLVAAALAAAVTHFPLLGPRRRGARGQLARRW
jgi:rod shape-determining protein MreD